jgi:energy-converting hydrogenase Eha subunit H
VSYGALASLGFDIPLGGSTGLVIDGRYTLGLSELSAMPATFTWKPSDIQAFVGLRFGGSK